MGTVREADCIFGKKNTHFNHTIKWNT